jgi:threonine/homoserine/homoserine lactone efflux protein
LACVFLLILNPKAWVIIVLMFTQFLDQSDKGTLAAGVLITTVLTFNNLITFLAWALIGNKISEYS